MPWYFNRDPLPLRVTLNSGKLFCLMPRQDVYIAPNDVSSDIQNLVNNGQVRRRRGDDIATVASDLVQVVELKKAEENLIIDDTSSDIQPIHDIKLANDEEPISVPSEPILIEVIDTEDADETMIKRRSRRRK